ncbi:MAG: hypothetical protein WCY43_03700 [Patescibacteria group bacterium]|nr:hypothetical protein [Patescibacteria group bacterium]
MRTNLKAFLISVNLFLLSSFVFGQSYLSHEWQDQIEITKTKNLLVTILNKTVYPVKIVPIQSSTSFASLLKTEQVYNGMYFATVSGEYAFKEQVYSRNFAIDIAKYGKSFLNDIDYDKGDLDSIGFYMESYLARYLIIGVEWEIGGQKFETALIKEMKEVININEDNHFKRIVIDINEEDLGIAKRIEFTNLGNFSIQLKNDNFLVVLENDDGSYRKPVFDGSLPPDGVYDFEALIKLPDLGWKKIRDRESIKLAMISGSLKVSPEDILGGIVKSPATTPAAEANQNSSSKKKIDLVLFPGSKRHKDVWLYNGYNKGLIFYIPISAEEGNQALSDDRVMPHHLDNTGIPTKVKLYPGVYPVFYVDKDFNDDYVVFSNLTVGDKSRQKASFTKKGIRKF